LKAEKLPIFALLGLVVILYLVTRNCNTREAGRTGWAVGRAARGTAGAVAEVVTRATAELPAASLNRLAATCAMQLDLEALKHGEVAGPCEVAGGRAAERVAKGRRARGV